MPLASEVDIFRRFQIVYAPIGELAPRKVPVQIVMNEAIQLKAEALKVELCKILIPRDSHEFLYLAADFGWRYGLMAGYPIEGGTNSQAGYVIRMGRHVMV